ncbi:hypothetical protein JCM9957A_11160 [Kineosporia succinea]
MDLALTSEIAAAAQAPSQEQAGRLAKHNSGSRASQSLAVASLPGTLVPGFVTILCFILGLLAISPVIAIVIAAKSKKLVGRLEYEHRLGHRNWNAYEGSQITILPDGSNIPRF